VALYWNARQYPILADRSPAEREQIIEAALKQHGRPYRRRLLVVIVALVLGLYASWPRLAADPLSSWRGWILPLAAALVLRIYFLWETNGSIHAAVRTYLAEREQRPGAR
jgi:hypothetical protein